MMGEYVDVYIRMRQRTRENRARKKDCRTKDTRRSSVERRQKGASFEGSKLCAKDMQTWWN